MNEVIALDALPNKDYQAALAVLNQLGDCRTQEELNRLIKTALIPLLDCSGAFYSWHEEEQSTPKLLDDINQSSLCRRSWKNFLAVAMQSQLLENPVTGETTTRLATDAFCCTVQNCQHCSLAKSCHRVDNCCAIVALFDATRPTVALYFCRLKPHEQYYNLRDLELLKLLRATLLQTIKEVMFQEECQNIEQINDNLSDHAEPLAIVQKDGGLVYKNQVFDQTFDQENIKRLATDFSKVIKLEPGKTEQYSFLSQLGRRLYAVTAMQVKKDANGNEHLYLLSFSRNTYKSCETYRKLGAIGLTSREQEIAMLIHQGMSTRNISGQLNLSYHTVRNHIKHIYRKIGVSTRSEMLTWAG